jgi:pimeloyl-ACP methyl ester carboxylesterase
MEAFADAVATLLARRGIARAIVVGGSMGGVVAQPSVGPAGCCSPGR